MKRVWMPENIPASAMRLLDESEIGQRAKSLLEDNTSAHGPEQQGNCFGALWYVLGARENRHCSDAKESQRIIKELIEDSSLVLGRTPGGLYLVGSVEAVEHAGVLIGNTDIDWWGFDQCGRKNEFRYLPLEKIISGAKSNGKAVHMYTWKDEATLRSLAERLQ
jgi:hypothetical protein